MTEAAIIKAATGQDKPSPRFDYQIIDQMMGFKPSMILYIYIMAKAFMPRYP